MIRILFVDDEPKILDGLRRMLRHQRRRWEMVFAPGGEEALAELERGQFDVIVTDMRMPKVDGAALLKHAQDRYPNTVRIVLSGHMELEATLRAVPVAHQFLTKPCDPEVLEEVVERACNLRVLLDNEAVRQMVGGMESLPSLPRLYSALTKALADPEVPLSEVARIVEQDVAMCAKVLQLVNSAFFGLPRRISNIQTAVGYLGTTTLKNLVLSAEVFHAFEDAERAGGFSIESLQSHALLTASIARHLSPEKRMAEDAFTAALLHDIGKLVLAARLPEHLSRVLAAVGASGHPFHLAEEELGGVTHAEIGAYLLGLWGLPYPIVEAVAHHHAPGRVNQRRFDVLAAVHIANALAHEQESTPPGAVQPTREIDPCYLEALGVAGHLDAWRALAAEHAGATAGA